MTSSCAVPTFLIPPRPGDEDSRQRAVEALGVLNGPRDASVDDLAWLAAHACDAPIAVAGLMDNDRQWFEAACGLAGSEAPRDLTFCAHAILGSELMEVPDATRDPRFAGNPFVVGEPYVRFYAGVPLIGATGHAYGTLCVVDTVPRTLTARQREALERLARQAVKQLETRRSRNEAHETRQALATLLEGMPDGLVSCDAAGRLREFNHVAREWHGVDPRDVPPEQWAEHFDLFTADGSRHLHLDEIPLLRAFSGEKVRDAEIVVRARGKPPRSVLCNAGALVADGHLLGAVCVMRDVTELRAAESRLRDTELQMRSILEHCYDAFIAIEDDGSISDWNTAAEALFGWTAPEALGSDMAELIIPPASRAAHRAGFQRFMDTGVATVLNKRLQLPALHRDGRVFPVELTISEVRLAGRRVLTAFLHDISLRVETEARLRENEARLRTITDNAPALIAYVDHDERFRFANTAFGEWYGMDPAAVMGQSVESIRGPEVAAQMRPHMARALAGQRVVVDVQIPHAALGVRDCNLTLIPDVDESGATRGYHVMGFDVTAQKQLTRVLAEQALRDELTGLPNRAAWNEELARGLARANRNQVSAAVMFLDLDGFKAVNDKFGHAAGDAVLRAFATMLRRTLRASDLVARLAGDEFVVLLDHVGDLEGDPPRIAAKILEAAARGVEFEGHHLPIRPSIGIGVHRGPTFDPDTLVRCADQAMYVAKRSATRRFAVVECAPCPVPPAEVARAS